MKTESEARALDSYVIVLDSCCISKRLSRVYKGQTGFKFRGLRFRGFGCFVFEIWVLRFRVLGASFSRFGCFVLRSSFSSASFSKLPPPSALSDDFCSLRDFEGSVISRQYISQSLLRKLFHIRFSYKHGCVCLLVKIHVAWKTVTRSITVY